jgi:hypothetical protein
MAVNAITRVRNFWRAYALAFAYRHARAGELVLLDRKAGFFSIYSQVLGVLLVSDIISASVRLSFTTADYFAKRPHESGWWEQYFLDSVYGQVRNKRQASVSLAPTRKATRFAHLGLSLDRELAHQLSKRLQLKPEVADHVEAFAHNHFKKKLVVGIHYRGTDKVEGYRGRGGAGAYVKEADRISSRAFISVLQELPQEWNFFVASDEQPFLAAMEDAFGSRILAQEIERSRDGRPLHVMGSPSPDMAYRRGFDALTEALLLAKTDFIIRTNSNLSLVSGFFNPNIPMFRIDHLADLNFERWADAISRAVAAHSPKTKTGSAD